MNKKEVPYIFNRYLNYFPNHIGESNCFKISTLGRFGKMSVQSEHVPLVHVLPQLFCFELGNTIMNAGRSKLTDEAQWFKENVCDAKQ